MRGLFQSLRSRKRVRELLPREAIASIGQPFVDVLCSMYDGDLQVGFDGNTYEIDAVTRLGPPQGMLILPVGS
jgi:hypothetical protein